MVTQRVTFAIIMSLWTTFCLLAPLPELFGQHLLLVLEPLIFHLHFIWVGIGVRPGFLMADSFMLSELQQSVGLFGKWGTRYPLMGKDFIIHWRLWVMLVLLWNFGPVSRKKLIRRCWSRECNTPPRMMILNRNLSADAIYKLQNFMLLELVLVYAISRWSVTLGVEYEKLPFFWLIWLFLCFSELSLNSSVFLF